LPACDFPVTLSENKDSLFVHPAEVDGVKFYPGVIRFYSASYAATQNRTDTVLVYTRGTLEDVQDPAAVKPYSLDKVLKASRAVYNTGVAVKPLNIATPLKRNAKVHNAPKLNRVEGKVFDLKAQIEKLKK
jgi:hypothetical protein